MHFKMYKDHIQLFKIKTKEKERSVGDNCIREKTCDGQDLLNIKEEKKKCHPLWLGLAG